MPGDEFYLREFRNLSTERSYGGPIPHSKIVARAFSIGLDPCMIDVMARVIMAMDEGYREWSNEQSKRQE